MLSRADKILEALPSGLTKGQQQELSYCLTCWDEILVKEGMPTSILKLVPQKHAGLGSRVAGDCFSIYGIQHNIRVAIVVKKDQDGEDCLDVKFMQDTFLHELAHAVRAQNAEKTGTPDGIHDKKWQLLFNKLRAKYAATDRKMVDYYNNLKRANAKGSPNRGSSFYQEPKK